MSKNRVRLYAALAILLILVSVIAFAVPMERTAVFWLSYAFAVIAIAVQAYSYPKAFGGDSVRSRFYGFPIARVTTIYLILQLVLSLAVMLLSGAAQVAIPTWAAVIVYALLLGLTLIGLITAEGVREEVERQEAEKPKKTETMRGLQNKAAAMAATCENPELKSALDDLVEEFRYSDPVSSEATEKLEMRMDIMLDEIQRGGNAQLAQEIKKILAERNRACKQAK